MGLQREVGNGMAKRKNLRDVSSRHSSGYESSSSSLSASSRPAGIRKRRGKEGSRQRQRRLLRSVGGLASPPSGPESDETDADGDVVLANASLVAPIATAMVKGALGGLKTHTLYSLKDAVEANLEGYLRKKGMGNLFDAWKLYDSVDVFRRERIPLPLQAQPPEVPDKPAVRVATEVDMEEVPNRDDHDPTPPAETRDEIDAMERGESTVNNLVNNTDNNWGSVETSEEIVPPQEQTYNTCPRGAHHSAVECLINGCFRDISQGTGALRRTAQNQGSNTVRNPNGDVTFSGTTVNNTPHTDSVHRSTRTDSLNANYSTYDFSNKNKPSTGDFAASRHAASRHAAAPTNPLPPRPAFTETETPSARRPNPGSLVGPAYNSVPPKPAVPAGPTNPGTRPLYPNIPAGSPTGLAGSTNPGTNPLHPNIPSVRPPGPAGSPNRGTSPLHPSISSMSSSPSTGPTVSPNRGARPLFPGAVPEVSITDPTGSTNPGTRPLYPNLPQNPATAPAGSTDPRTSPLYPTATGPLPPLFPTVGNTTATTGTKRPAPENASESNTTGGGRPRKVARAIYEHMMNA